ncbi:MAG: tyrosine-type recombinase/integrase [Candidatus Babeliales bacterium]|jgi:integrase
MRLPNGYGSFYKLPGNRRRPYIARVTIGHNKNGRQIYKTIGYYEKPEGALKALAGNNDNPVSPKANITLKELYDEWSKSKYERISRQTEDNYKAGWKYLSKYGKSLFKEIRTSHLQGIIDACYKSGLSKSTLQKIKIVAGQLYDYAVENDILNKNYAKFMKIPKYEKQEKEPFSELEVKKLLDNINMLWVDTILILIYTGMRISEMLGLTKFSIDLENQTITGGLKTDAGKDRVIPIHPKIQPIIKKWYDLGGDRLICNEKKKPISARTYREDYYMPTLKALEIRELNPHSCRHTCATLLDKAGADTLSIQKILGHADYATTANIYTHTDIEKLRKAINLI